MINAVPSEPSKVKGWRRTTVKGTLVPQHRRTASSVRQLLSLPEFVTDEDQRAQCLLPFGQLVHHLAVGAALDDSV